MVKDVEVLEDIIKYKFKNRDLLVEALTHRSCKKSYDNERLEFLGDAVLDLIVGEYLFFELKDADEGELSKIRAALVNEKGFTKLAKSIDLGDFILISAAEEKNKGRAKTSILSNAFEALMGAIYLDSNLESVRSISVALLQKSYPVVNLKTLFNDHKTKLQEITQAKYGVTPDYEVIGSSGPDHKKEFEVSISIAGVVLATAKGKSKKEAHQSAANIAIKRLESNK